MERIVLRQRLCPQLRPWLRSQRQLLQHQRPSRRQQLLRTMRQAVVIQERYQNQCKRWETGRGSFESEGFNNEFLPLFLPGDTNCSIFNV